MENKYYKRSEIIQPKWKKLVVESSLPEKLTPLRSLARNLWWVWNTEARELFEYINAELWKECQHNPILLLEKVSYKRLLELEKSPVFLSKMKEVNEKFEHYLEERENPDGPKIAYFSMEYGLHDSLKIFSGGLGILAGDYLKEASDFNTNLVGVGLLYRYGYFKQVLNLYGEQMSNYEAQQFSKLPVQPAVDKDGNWVKVEVDYPGRKLYAQVWQVNIGSIKLYLLDADRPENQEQDRSVTHHLYGGDNENRLKQEILLGFGGIRALQQLDYDFDVYHCNEGHAAFIGLERLANLQTMGLTFNEAKEVVRSSTLFTTHTPVPAGHDSFHLDLFKHYMQDYANKIKIDWNIFEMLGKAYMDDDHFNMSYLASNLSQGINGVSKLHGEVSKDVLKELYPGYISDELEIGYVTNGVHYPTWTAQEWKDLHENYFGKKFIDNKLNFDIWEKIYQVPEEDIWELRKKLRSRLVADIKERFSDNWIKRNENPQLISEITDKLDENTLTIGFARRFATYKRGYLLFRNLDRLARIVNNPHKPVQFIFAGKAHPADKQGQDLIKKIVEVSKKPEFRGKIMFIQNYDMNLAKTMLQGVDVWLNTPTRPLEASGTSGMKGVMNGNMHFSVLDGWWMEGHQENAGWALSAEKAYDVQDYQDELDANTIYKILEDEIVPKFYERDKNDIPEDWVGYIKNTIAHVAPHFTTTRMMDDYLKRYYIPLKERTTEIVANDFQKAKEIANWKIAIKSKWDEIEVKNIEISDGVTNVMKIGQEYPVRITLDLKGLSPDEIGVELVTTELGSGKDEDIASIVEFEIEKCENTICTYKQNLHPDHPGSFSYGFRMFPKHEGLPHRQDFKLLRWISQ